MERLRDRRRENTLGLFREAGWLVSGEDRGIPKRRKKSEVKKKIKPWKQ